MISFSGPLGGDLVPSLEAREPKDRGRGERKGTNQGAVADGNRRDTSPRVARRCAREGGITEDDNVWRLRRKAVRMGGRNGPLNYCGRLSVRVIFGIIAFSIAFMED